MADAPTTTGKTKNPVLASVVISVGVIALIAWLLMRRYKKDAITFLGIETKEYSLLDRDADILVKPTDEQFKANRNIMHKIALSVPTKANNIKGLVYHGRRVRLHNYTAFLEITHTDDIINLNQIQHIELPSIEIGRYGFCDFIYDEKIDKWYCLYDYPSS